MSEISSWLFEAVQNNFWGILAGAFVILMFLTSLLTVIIMSLKYEARYDKLCREKLDLERCAKDHQNLMREVFLTNFLPLLMDSRNRPLLKSIILRIKDDNLAAYTDWLLIADLVNACIGLIFPDKANLSWYKTWKELDKQARNAGDKVLKALDYATDNE